MWKNRRNKSQPKAVGGKSGQLAAVPPIKRTITTESRCGRETAGMSTAARRLHVEFPNCGIREFNKCQWILPRRREMYSMLCFPFSFALPAARTGKENVQATNTKSFSSSSTLSAAAPARAAHTTRAHKRRRRVDGGRQQQQRKIMFNIRFDFTLSSRAFGIKTKNLKKIGKINAFAVGVVSAPRPKGKRRKR